MLLRCCGDFGGSTEWNEKMYDRNRKQYGNDDIVRFVVDTKHKYIAYYVNDKQVLMLKIEKESQLDCSVTYRFFIDLWNQASVKFV